MKLKGLHIHRILTAIYLNCISDKQFLHKRFTDLQFFTMMNRFFTIIFFLVTLFSFVACSPNAYRIRNVKNNGSANNEVEFILPPSAKLASEGVGGIGKTLIFSTGSNFRYQYVVIQGLSKNYTECLQVIDQAKYFNSKNQQVILLRENYKINGSAKPVGAGNFANYYSSTNDPNYKSGDKINIAIELDLDKLLNSEANYIKNYQQLATELLTTLVKLENDLATSISQNIIEKIWEQVPVPQGASLSRSLITISDQKSIVLLNPRISLKVDNLLFFNDPNGASEFSGFNYYLSGQIILSFFRNSNGKIKQSSFLKIDENATPNFLPNNSIVSNIDKVNHLQASSIDVQLSSITNKKFYGLYQNFLKRNNDKSFEGTSNDKKDDELYRGGSIMLFSDDPENIIDYPNGVASNTVQSSFCNGKLIYTALTGTPGCRSIITPVISINLNTNSQFITLGTTIGDWLQISATPSKSIQLFRLYNGKLKEMKGFNYDTFLLPGDKISTK